MKESRNSMHETWFIHTVALVGAGICFILVTTLLVSRLFQKVSVCCCDLFQSKSKQKRRKYKSLETACPDPIFTRGKQKTKKVSNVSIGSVSAYNTAEFEIPLDLKFDAVQPEGSVSSGYSTGDVSLADSVEYPSGRRVRYSDDVQNKAPLSGTYLTQTVQPELYSSGRKKTQGPSSFGKLSLTLQYDDATKKQLLMTLTSILNLQFFKEKISNIYISAILLPDRQNKFETKLLPPKSTINIGENFVFHSRTHNSDFESRTINFKVIYVDESGKASTYGESFVSLISHEIFSQVPTTMTIGVKPCAQQPVVGDLQISLSYFSSQKRLNVTLKFVQFMAPVLENLKGIHAKLNIADFHGSRITKKKSITQEVQNKESKIIEFHEPVSFTLDSEKFVSCTLKITLHGHYKFLGKKNANLGKVKIGHNSDSSGTVHWNQVSNAEGVDWTMWHALYST